VIFLGLGSNLGDRNANLQQAIEHLKKIGIIIEKTSSVIETDPVGGPPQGKYLNLVLKAKTDLSPHELLSQLKTLEEQLGRIPSVRNGPRVIDIDILIFDHVSMASDELTIPHPRMSERDFVLRPLREIEPNFQELFLK